MILDEHRSELENRYRFEYSTKYTVEELSDKELQVRLAKEAGLDVPECYTIMSLGDIPENPPFQCIIKPLVSMRGSKLDLIVCNNMEELVFCPNVN